ncbi:hypothetical protein SAMN05421874_107316 [Nonomuraea maritima]|uniref:Uncharacterized protein n=1 Tax=Nonomuraea maritima TaxID=683260 RepID=A0A1G9BW60_9ACTN|nr:hypothetical protein SAMN05421874_107316 [Nonomuraea maritima]
MTLGLAVPFVDPAALVAWARRADAGPYARIGVPDRIVYDNPEPMLMPPTMSAQVESWSWRRNRPSSPDSSSSRWWSRHRCGGSASQSWPKTAYG